MSESNYVYPVNYKGANVSFIKQLTKVNQKGIYYGCVKREYKKFTSAENDPNISNAQRVSQILRSNSLGGKINFGNVNNNRNIKYNTFSAIQPIVITPIRNKF